MMIFFTGSMAGGNEVMEMERDEMVVAIWGMDIPSFGFYYYCTIAIRAKPTIAFIVVSLISLVLAVAFAFHTPSDCHATVIYLCLNRQASHLLETSFNYRSFH